MRKLATIRKIESISPIKNADNLEAAQVGGWVVVIRRGEFKPGDLAVYLEIDSWVPVDIAPFLSKGQTTQEFNGVKGHRLRTIKLRGQISQGLLLSLETVFPTATGLPVEGQDVTEILKIQKWEPPLPAQLAGQVRGAFPSFIPKTDQERIQNLTTEFHTWDRLNWEVTEKLDGSSMTVYFKNGDFGVCSRNWNLKESETNSLWQQAKVYKLDSILGTQGNFAVQGELIGEGIQGNPYALRGQDFLVFDVFNIDEQRYLRPAERMEFVNRIGLKHVPIINKSVPLPASVKDILNAAEGKSQLHTSIEREGLVFKLDGTISFKVISNKFLLLDK